MGQRAAAAAFAVAFLLASTGTATVAWASAGGGRTVPYGEVYQVAFAVPGTGYALVEDAGGLSVATSSDGGRSWHAVVGGPHPPMPSSAMVASGRERPPVVDATSGGDVVVYWGDRADVSAAGGAQWSYHVFPGAVEGISGEGGQLWALVDGAAPKGPAWKVGAAPGWLYVSSDDGRDWARRSLLPRGFGPYADLLQATVEVGYALAAGEYNTYAGAFGGLAMTTNGGLSWQKVRQPCAEDASPRFGYNVSYGSGGREDLWMVCGQEEGLYGGRLTQVALSTDYGRKWSVVAGTRLVMLVPNFPDASYVPLASEPATGAFIGGQAYLVLKGPSILVHTGDVGRTWAKVGPRRLEEQGPQQVFDLGGTLLVRTTDALWRSNPGGGWQELASG